MPIPALLRFLPIVGLSAAPLLGLTPQPVDFNRDVRPILSDKCFACHGFDRNKRKGGLRLDTAEGALAGGKSGRPAFVAGKPDESALVGRIRHTDPDEVMPPPDHPKALTGPEKDLLVRWIAQGGKYADHWAYLPVRRPEVPAVEKGRSPRNPVDAFVQDRLRREGLQPLPEADRRTLVRRLSFDLHGVAPEPDVVGKFAASKDPKEWERLVDRFLDSPRFAERQAQMWLDLVRYADSIGFHGDCTVSVWPYRDYVLRSFHENRPFDRFTREQIAGDLLPGADEETRIASGYNRLNRMSTEGGVQDKEYLAKYAADRVRTTSIAWLGSTLGCAECHDHKFDPFSSRDFYSFAAFFADLQEQGFYDRGFTENEWGPRLRLPDPAQKAELARLESGIALREAALEAVSDGALTADRAAWEAAASSADAARSLGWRTLQPTSVSTLNGTVLGMAGNWIRASGPNPDTETYVVRLTPGAGRWTALRLQTGTDEEMPGNRIARNGTTFHVTGVDLELRDPAGSRVVDLARARVSAASEGHPGLALVDGDPDTSWAVGEGHSRDHQAVLHFRAPVETGPGTELVFRIHHGSRFPRTAIGRFQVALSSWDSPGLGSGVPEDVLKALRKPAAERTPEEATRIRNHHRSVASVLADDAARLEDLRDRRSLLLGRIPSTLVSEARKEPRTLRILPRGNWMDDSGPVVVPAIPARFQDASGKADGTRRLNRLDLADWLTRPENPMTARVFVNRQWRNLFGAGLSRVLDDVGSQGEWPSHPELLDWLAAEFMSPTPSLARPGRVPHAWDVKHLVRVVATSAAYRRSSMATPGLMERDPDNRLLARQGRFRVDAESVRDSALSAAGLLVDRVGGPSVRPPQPEGYWAALNFPKREYVPGVGEELHRRSLYTHWQRTFVHPAMAAFDAPSREECTATRVNSNTPLQALVLLNDVEFVEAAHALAAEALRRHPGRPEEAVAALWRRTLSRPPTRAELDALMELHRQQSERYSRSPDEAAALLSSTVAVRARDLPPASLAAMGAVARTVLNLHEAITRN